MSGAAASAGASKFSTFLNHPAGAVFIFLFHNGCAQRRNCVGPKTVFFWAPVMKWCLVAAGLKDLTRPADKLSVSQNIGADSEFRLFQSFLNAAHGKLWPQRGLFGCDTLSLLRP